MYKNEKEFTTDFIKDLGDVWYYKIPDDSRGYKPFDIITCENWVSVAYELKNIKKTLTDNVIIESLEQHQVASLFKVHKAGWKAYAVYYDNTTDKIVKKSIVEILDLIKKKYGSIKWF